VVGKKKTLPKDNYCSKQQYSLDPLVGGPMGVQCQAKVVLVYVIQPAEGAAEIQGIEVQKLQRLIYLLYPSSSQPAWCFTLITW